jgi:hypothetical protein
VIFNPSRYSEQIKLESSHFYMTIKLVASKLLKMNGPIFVLMRAITGDFEILKLTPLFVDSVIEHTVLYPRQF